MSIKKRQLPPFDPAQQRERQEIESAVANVASSDSRFQPWWALYRNRHHRQRVAILSHVETGEGTYLWHFHLVRKIDRSEQEELLAAMRSVLHTALDPLGLTIKAGVPPGDGEPVAYIVFSVPVSADEARRRVEARRTWNEEYSRQDGQMRQALDAVRAALAAGQPLPKCPFCGSQLEMDVRELALNTSRTNRRAVLTCATPQCFMASIPMPAFATHEAISVTVVQVDALTSGEQDEIERLCTRAFEQDFAGLFDLVRGGEDPLHVVARSRGRIVGHACWATRRLYLDDAMPLRTAYVDAVATEPALQGRGLGSLVIARLVAEVRQRGYQLGALSTSRVSFYERQGWERWHGPTAVREMTGQGQGLQPTPEHTVLILRTHRTPPLDTTHLLVAEPRGGDPW